MSGLRVLLGVTGGIAAYKALDLVRRLRAEAAEVQVVMTRAAAHFVGAASFQALSGNPVRDELWDPAAEAAMGHIELARWAQRLVIAPATAQCLARLRTGLADDLLSTLALATRAPVFLAPAMNQAMWLHPATQDNLTVLKSRGVHILGPDHGAQACGDVGPGRMLEPEAIIAALRASVRPPLLRGCSIVVSAGPTFEDLDPVRFLGNRSSGRMGYALAEAAQAAGADVTLISGPVQMTSPAGVRLVAVRSAQQMLDAVLAACTGADVYIGAAAIADYRPANVAAQKIKKEAEHLSLELVRNPDVISAVAALPRRPLILGFAAETEKLIEHAEAKRQRKRMDLIAANLVGVDRAFDRDDNALTVLDGAGAVELGHASKRELAWRLIEIIASKLAERNP